MPAWRGCEASRELPVCIGAICSGASSMGEALCWPRFRATHPFAFFASLRSAVRHRRARNLSLSSTSVQTRAFLNLKASKVSTRAFLTLKASKTSLAPPPRLPCVLSVPAVCRCGAELGGLSSTAVDCDSHSWLRRDCDSPQLLQWDCDSPRRDCDSPQL